jgi:hypothetical protein
MRTDSTHVVACVRDLNRVEFVTETLRCALEALSVAAPDWLAGCGLVTPAWLERYGQRADSCRLPKGDGPRGVRAHSLTTRPEVTFSHRVLYRFKTQCARALSCGWCSQGS